MIVILWEHALAIVCLGQHAMMILYGIGLTVGMAIGTTKHWIEMEQTVILLQVLLVINLMVR